jgi:hypothetical protein
MGAGHAVMASWLGRRPAGPGPITVVTWNDVADTEDQLGLVLVVTSAAQREVIDCGRAVQRVRMDVVELEEAALRAAVS